MRCMPSRNCSSSRADFSALIADPDIIGLHISPKGRGNEAAGARQPVCVGGGAVWDALNASDVMPAKAGIQYSET